MFLVDTNVWLELILQQKRADEVRRFMEAYDARLLAITEFSFYSIGIILTKLKKDDDFEEFVSDTIKTFGVPRIRLNTVDFGRLIAVRRKFSLDFDDAYQYVAAEKHGLTIVSFDTDFDRTERKRKTPGEALRMHHA